MNGNRSGNRRLGPDPFVDQWICTADDAAFLWDHDNGALRPRSDPSFCLARNAHGPAKSADEARKHLALAKCSQAEEQLWDVKRVLQ